MDLHLSPPIRGFHFSKKEESFHSVLRLNDVSNAMDSNTRGNKLSLPQYESDTIAQVGDDTLP